MSSTRATYLGVYLIVDQYREVDHNERECGNNPHHRCTSAHGGNKFCGECGSEIILVKKTNKSRLSSYDAADLFGFEDDTFTNVDRGDKPCIWLANTESGIDLEGYGGHREVTPDDIYDAVNQFKTDHRAELQLLEDNNVEYSMLFGLVIHYR